MKRRRTPPPLPTLLPLFIALACMSVAVCTGRSVSVTTTNTRELLRAVAADPASFCEITLFPSAQAGADIQGAIANATGELFVVCMSPGLYTGFPEPVLIEGPTSIILLATGNGVVLDGRGVDRILVANKASPASAIVGLTLHNATGAVTVNGGSLGVLGCNMSECHAQDGAGIYAINEAELYVNGSMFFNMSASDGGGIYCSHTRECIITDSAFYYCFAAKGAGVYMGHVTSDASISGSLFIANYATNGALFLLECPNNVFVTDCQFEANAGDIAAAIALESATYCYVTKCVFIENVAVNGYVIQALTELSLVNVQAFGNTNTFLIASHFVSIQTSTFVGNGYTSAADVATLECHNEGCEISDSVLVNNTAGDYYGYSGGISCQGSVVLYNTTLEGNTPSDMNCDSSEACRVTTTGSCDQFECLRCHHVD